MSSILLPASSTLVEVTPTYDILNRIATTYFPHAINITGVVLHPYFAASPSAPVAGDLRSDDLRLFTYKEGDIEAILSIGYANYIMIYLSTEPLFGYVEEVTAPFADDEKQRVYEASQGILRRIFRDWVNPFRIGAINRIWIPTLRELFEFTYNGPCIKYILPASRLAEEDENVKALPSLESIGLVEDVIREEDVDTIISYNKLKYPRKYVIDCARISSCIREKADGKLVAWCLSHDDLSLSSLHTLPTYRGSQLARRILHSLARKHVDLYSNHLFGLPKIYVHLDVEAWNEGAMRMFERYGWTPCVANAWVECVRRVDL